MSYRYEAKGPVLLANVKPIAFGASTPNGPIDILINADGRIAEVGPSLAVSTEVQRIDGNGAWISPGWIDLHVHIWHGGTDISLRPSECGAERGVTTLVDAGSAGEANFHGFREYIIEPSRERIKAFINLGSIGLVACNRVPELRSIQDINLDRILEVYAENSEHIVGIKVRASHVITGSWGVTPVKLGKKIAKILKIPMMVHVGEPPALYDEVLEILGPGDIVTHCFNGKAGSSIMEDEDLFDLAERCAGDGIRLDIGHGGASFSFKVAEAAIKRGLLPFSISTDLHDHSMNFPVWDLATTMSKLLVVGMPFDKVVEAVTQAPASVIKLPMENRLAVGERADFTVFDLVDADIEATDSNGDVSVLTRIFEPRYAIIGAEAVSASRYIPRARKLVRHSHGYSYR
ncbi:MULTISPECIES: amidohydrolase/deacetylase family metallohydrolase [Sinorhizobium]|jgi:dihydroorotase|uniref:amidohydrolase/deacetylase family metallohydrolase n=1 Tax=Sinorhizobium TaxID=28105 RepID=UPI000C99A837|nr:MULTISPECIES: amidohydrolase/deacetylase family metallohydrolase [Sinorhizobium]MCG5486797.1 amidohydrolase/deacetylase family metallohydrolase [Sinorhizobium meliloti]PND19810.1 amidohydrolase/deacetylase family metallohydrolase [Ensifer sp. MMN_5]PND25125.1 amidohydrolase/deacetylase family metallohydrolase [Sinorhizobium sp. M4_45]RVQ02220.1 amidohydrolase/deacetylase family metallohydrolase [Sinorhizobium meliloti]